MERQTDGSERELGIAATAVMGAAAGAVGVWALDRVDWFMWDRLDEETRARTIAARPGGEPPAHVLVGKVERMAGIAPSERQHEIAGQIVHYTIGIGPAVGYALTRDKLPGRGPVRGLLYGFGLFLAQDEALNTVSGLGAKPQDYPWQAHARGLIAHLVYGVATELALNAMEKAVRSAGSGAGTERRPQPRLAVA